MKKTSKKDFTEFAENFFQNIQEKSPTEIRKIMRISMKNGLKLKDKRKLFCKKCFKVYKSPKIRIINGIKSVECENCGCKNRWRIKPS